MTAKREQYLKDLGVVYIRDSKAKIPIYKPVAHIAELKTYLDNLPSDCPYLFARKTPQGYVQLTHTAYRKAWEYSIRKCNLSDLRVHDLRHFSSSRMYEDGWDERTIMEIAGWKTNMLSTYWHKDPLRSAQKIIKSGGKPPPAQ
jgi:integrase